MIKRVCMMLNGNEVRVLFEMEGDRMIEYDERGNKRYEGGWSGDWIDHQICLQYLISQVVMAL